MTKDEFRLYDLDVSVEGDASQFVCSHQEGHAFKVEGENLIFDSVDRFSLYGLSSLLPLLPAKQRVTDSNDWMSTDDYVACPDPNCGAKFKITRLQMRTFKHSDVTVPHPTDKSS